MYLKNAQQPLQPKKILLRHINKVLDTSFPKSSCLSRSIVKLKVLAHYGYLERIYFGINIDDGIMSAHAWLSMETKLNFEPVYSIK